MTDIITTAPDIATWTEQINRLIEENRRLHRKSEADDKTIAILKDQYDTLHAGVEDMVEDHRRRERELIDAANRHEVAYTEIDGLLGRAADLIVQAGRARVGNRTPSNQQQLAEPADSRLPSPVY